MIWVCDVLRASSGTGQITIEQTEINLNKLWRLRCMLLISVDYALRLLNRLSTIYRRYLKLRNRVCSLLLVFFTIYQWFLRISRCYALLRKDLVARSKSYILYAYTGLKLVWLWQLLLSSMSRQNYLRVARLTAVWNTYSTCVISASFLKVGSWIHSVQRLTWRCRRSKILDLSLQVFVLCLYLVYF